MKTKRIIPRVLGIKYRHDCNYKLQENSKENSRGGLQITFHYICTTIASDVRDTTKPAYLLFYYRGISSDTVVLWARKVKSVYK